MTRQLTRREFLYSTAAAAASRDGFSAPQGPSPGAARRPNVLWIMTDEHRVDSLGCYGSPWARSPHMDNLARHGVLFRHAVTPSPVCVPARVSLLSGRYPAATGVLHNVQKPSPEERWLTESFVEKGYQTASFGKSHYRSDRKAFQTEGGKTLSEAVHYFRYADQYPIDDYDVVRYPNKPFHWILAGRYPAPVEETAAYQNVSEALDWCRALDGSRPFLLRLSFNEPHTPYVVPPPYDTQVDPAQIRLPGPSFLPSDSPVWDREGLAPIQGSGPLNEQQLRRMWQVYYGLVTFLDSQIGRLLNSMGGMGLLENTIIALVADHGTHLGDHGLLQKMSFYQASVEVPFLFHWPGRLPAGVVVKTPVETISLVPTLMDLCGLEIPSSVQCPSLAPALRDGREPDIKQVFSEIDLAGWGYRPGRRIIMIREGRWKMAVYRQPGAPADTPCPDGALYDLESDPEERINRYHDPAAGAVIDELMAKIQERDGRVL